MPFMYGVQEYNLKGKFVVGKNGLKQAECITGFNSEN